MHAGIGAMLAALASYLIAGAALAADPAAKAVTVTPTPEAELGVIRLSAQAEQRLGITTAVVELRAVARRRVYGGQVVVPPGQVARLAAPFAGIARAHPRGAVPAPGHEVRRGDPLMGLEPILTEPERLRAAEVQINLAASRADADGQLKRAEAAYKLAKLQAERGSRLVAAEAGSQRALDEARAGLITAEAALAAAKARRDLFAKADLPPPGEMPVTPLSAPIAGVVRELGAVPGQTVAAGALLVEVADLSKLWVRVPVPVDEDRDVGREPARLREEGAAGDEVVAQPVSAPPSASASSATIDRWYALPNRASRWTPGMRVLATLSVTGRASLPAVPHAAIVTDVNGDAWVYARHAPGVYARKRVSVERVEGDVALLAAAPAPGTAVAVTGVAELFGVDVGFAK